MCAIIGFIGFNSKSRPDFGVLEDAIWANLKRGPDAWGVAGSTGSRVSIYKEPGSIVDALPAVRVAIESTKSAAVGIHMRWATRGNPEDNSTNHPHEFARGALIHNGTVTWAEKFSEHFGLETSTECDSEALAAYLATQRHRFRIDRVRATAEAAKWWSDPERHRRHALMAFWPNLVCVAKAGKPLAMLKRKEGLYLASLPADVRWKRYRGEFVFGINVKRSGFTPARATPMSLESTIAV